MAEIPLGRRGQVIAYVDDEDADRTSAAGPWCLAKRNGAPRYVFRNLPNSGNRYRPGAGPSAEKLHRFILGYGPGDPGIDHKDGDPLNCRRGNLRPATQPQNGQNLSLVNNRGASRYRGVTFHRATGKWRATLTIQRQRVELGLHLTEDAAAQAVRDYVTEYLPFYGRRE